MTLFIHKSSRSKFDNHLASFGRVLCIEHLFQLLQCTIFGFDIEEIDNPASDEYTNRLFTLLQDLHKFEAIPKDEEDVELDHGQHV